MDGRGCFWFRPYAYPYFYPGFGNYGIGLSYRCSSFCLNESATNKMSAERRRPPGLADVIGRAEKESPGHPAPDFFAGL